MQLGAFAVSSSIFALFLYLTLYLQDYLGYSPLQAGLRYLPITLATFFVAPIAGALLGRILGARVLMAIGLAGVGVGLLLMSGLSADSWLDRPSARLPLSPASASACSTRSSPTWR